MSFKKYFWTIINNPFSSIYVLIHYLRRIFPLDYWWGRGYSFFPDFITILITERCNFFCKRCSSASPRWTKEFLKSGQRELTTEEIKKLLDEVAYFKPSIYFCGGEPTLRKDLWELLKYAKEKKMITGFVTNGSLMNDAAIKKLFESKVDFVSFSLDGLPSYHNKLRGFPMAYERAVGSLSKIINYRKKHHLHYPHLRIAAVIDHEHIENSYHVLRVGKRLGVDEVSFGALMYYPKSLKRKQEEFLKRWGAGGNYLIGLEVEDDYKFNFNLKKLKKFYREVAKEKEVRVVMISPEEKYLADYFNVRKFPTNKSVCLTPWFTALVKSNGDVSLCQGIIGGNILKEKFMKIWNKEEFKKFRRVRKSRVSPACFRCNEGQKIKF